MVRIGLLQYGYIPHPIIDEDMRSNGTEGPRPVMSWQSNLIDVKWVKKGEWIGYGFEFEAAEDLEHYIKGNLWDSLRDRYQIYAGYLL